MQAGRVRAGQRSLAKSLLFLIPALLLVGVFRYYPLLSAIYHSFASWNAVTSRFIGVSNYAKLLHDSYFWISLRNAGIYVLVRIVAITFFCVLGAELIYNLRSARHAYFWRTLFVLPLVIPVSVIILLWKFIYNPVLGLLNAFLAAVGLVSATAAPAWIGDPSTALYAIAGVGFPFLATVQFLIILSSLQSIEPSILESASVDGATRLKRIIWMDLPLIMDKILLAVTLTVIGDFQNVQNFLVMTNGGPGTSTLVPGLYVYQTAFEYNTLGYSCAIGVAMTIIILVVVSHLNFLTNRVMVRQ